MSKTTRPLLLALVSLLIVLAAAIAAIDRTWLRDVAAAALSRQTGRACVIAGDFRIELALTPRLHAEDVKLGNPAWADGPWMLEAESLDVRVDLLRLLHGEVVLPEVTLAGARLNLQRNAEGARNWVLKRAPTAPDGPPRIGRLRLDGSIVEYRDAIVGADLRVGVDMDSGADDPGRALRFAGAGRFKGLLTGFEGYGGSVLRLHDESAPYPLSAKLRFGETRIHLAGSITGLATLSYLDLAVDAQGQDLAQLYPLLGIVTPPTPPYHFAGHLAHDGKVWRLSAVRGRIGDSDVAGRMRVDGSGERPRLTGVLESQELDFDDLAGFIGAPPASGRGERASVEQRRAAQRAARRARVLPDEPFHVQRLDAMDADFTLVAHRIHKEGLPLDSLHVRALLEHGVLRLDPLHLGVAGGRVTAQVTARPQDGDLAVDARMQFANLRLARLFSSFALARSSSGQLGGRVDLSAHGPTFAALAGSANGEVSAIVNGGEVSNLLLEIAGLDGGEVIKFLLAGDRRVALHCAVADFGVRDGLMSSRLFVIDTADTNFEGQGTISLRDETLDLTLTPQPKDSSILAARVPLRVTGSFRVPRATPSLPALTARLGGATLLGVIVNPLAALLPLIETGPGAEHNCNALTRRATRPPGAGP